MPDSNNNPLSKFAEAVRKQLHEHDIRMTKLETANKVAWGVIGIVIALSAVIVAIISLHNKTGG